MYIGMIVELEQLGMLNRRGLNIILRVIVGEACDLISIYSLMFDFVIASIL